MLTKKSSPPVVVLAGTAHHFQPTKEITLCELPLSEEAVATPSTFTAASACSHCYPPISPMALDNVRRGLVRTSWTSVGYVTEVKSPRKGPVVDVTHLIEQLYQLGYVSVDQTGLWKLTKLGALVLRKAVTGK